MVMPTYGSSLPFQSAVSQKAIRAKAELETAKNWSSL